MDYKIIFFLVVYLFIVVAVVAIELHVLTNDKEKYLFKSYSALMEICKDCEEKQNPIIDDTILSVSRFYEEYVQEEPRIKRFFPNVIVLLDAIIFRINCGKKRACILREYKNVLEAVRNELEIQNPYNKCEKYQQDILHDISELETNANKIVVTNIIKRTEDEFIRLSNDIKKNDRLSKLSLFVGVFGMVVSIITGFSRF